MRPNRKLIPRFNKEYAFGDFIYGLNSIFKKKCFDLELLDSIFSHKQFYFTNNGRTSLYVILTALNLPKGSKIGVPLYSCPAVFDAILKAGYNPKFIDVDLVNYTMDPADLEEKIKDLSAIVVIHTFGRPADMDKIRDVAGDIPIIEDCAHSFLSEYKGKKTGTLGFASFFSFMKYLSTGGGSLLILNSNKYTDETNNEIKKLSSWSIINEIKHSFYIYGYSFLYHKPWFGLFACPLGSFIKEGKNNSNDFKLYHIRKNDFSLLSKKLNTFYEKLKLQRQNSFYLINELKDTFLILPYEKKEIFCNYYLFPIRFEKLNDRNRAYKYLRDMGVDTAKLYSKTPENARKIYGYQGDCGNSEILANSILTVPNYYSLTKEEIIYIKNCIIKMEKTL